ncbi:glycosyltransferase family 4 protein [Prevotella sp. P6B1]|uniref:glycosyltransferase family 4 protein n=1 Tax=Prevotella sp. P6B1 TaxID=1410613 RepID=UPI000A4DDDE6|nr:glycosyltransferase family 4 protein [Prevotella sp. P6B1]
MKVVVTGTRGIPNIMGGIETHCEELLPRLVQLGYDITIIRRSSYVREDKPLTEWEGVKIIDIDAPKSKNFEAIIHTFRAINKAKALGADLVHIHAIGPNLLSPYARLLGMKVVMTHHGPDYNRDKWGKVAKMMLKLGERLGCMFANQVIVISNTVKTLIEEKCGRTKNVTLIPNGVKHPETCSYPEYFCELGIEEGKYILGMCRFVPEKNLHHLIDAFLLLKKSKRIPNDMRLVLAGDADFEDDYSMSLKKKAKENHVVLTGFVKDRKLHSLLTHASCFCLPSSHEGLPIALLEAMAYNIPVVASDIPANMEIRLDESHYFPCGDIEKLADRLEGMISRSQKIHYDMSLYAWNIIAIQTAEVYNKSMPQNKS